MKPAEPASPWFPYRTPRPEARLRLFCFPFAGKGASVFRPWQPQLPPWIEALVVQYPGRETRFHEPPFRQLDHLVEALIPELMHFLDRPFALFGHSMGALLAFEVARRLRHAQGPQPAHLFVSGYAAPQTPRTAPPVHDLPEPEFRRVLQRYGGTPEDVLANEELMELLSPLVRADFAVRDSYVYSAQPPGPAPLTVFGGLEDEIAPWHSLVGWREQTSGPFGLYLLKGGHFFPLSAEPVLLQLLTERLAKPAVADLTPPGADEVHVWTVPLTVPAGPLAGLAATLSDDERQRAARFVRAPDRDRFVTTRGALRSILSRYFGLPPSDFRFGYTPHGKPFLLEPPAAPLQFNVSHGEGLALVAVSCGRAVGVDAERLRANVDIEEVGRVVFSESARSALRALPPEERRGAFFDQWARQEALLKCFGVGFSGLNSRNEPIPHPGAGDCFVTNLRPAPGYAAAVAVEGGCSHLRCFHWSVGKGGDG
jgi:medium-chain acyl-[acyl-carrier-protein] hydrolase